MSKTKLSDDLASELKQESKKDRKRRLLANLFFLFTAIIFVSLFKIYFFKGDIKIGGEVERDPSEKIENQLTTTSTSVSVTIGTETTTTTVTTKAPSFVEYTVKEGDTIGGIANENGMGSTQLMDYNGITDPLSLKPGQVIKIPK